MTGGNGIPPSGLVVPDVPLRIPVLTGSWNTMEGEGNWYVLSDLFEDGVIGLDDLVAFASDWMWVADWVIE